METPEHSVHRFQQITIIVVALGYGLAFADIYSDPDLSISAVDFAVVIVAGIIYLALALREDELLDRNPAPWKTAAYFVVQLTLSVIILWTFKTLNGVWLIYMPLVGTATSRLPGRWRVPFLILIVAALGLSAGLRYGTEAAVSYTLGILPAILFVVLFVIALVKEAEARERAEALAADLEDANHLLAEYALQAEELATAKERNRLAREIHDSLGHYLTIINVQLEAARVVLDSDRGKALDALDKAQRLTREGLTSVRRSVAALRDSPVGDRPLPDVLAALVKESIGSGIVTEFDVVGAQRPLEPNIELTLYRAVQEGLTNVRKHARASRVDLTLDYSRPDEVYLSVQDNGVGSRDADNGGYGLLGVQERVNLLGGSVETVTAPGKGFKLALAVPG